MKRYVLGGLAAAALPLPVVAALFLAACASDGRPHPIACASCTQALAVCPGVLEQCDAAGIAAGGCAEWEAVCVDPPASDDCPDDGDDDSEPLAREPLWMFHGGVWSPKGGGRGH